MVLRFSGHELDRPRAELRGLDGEVIKLRPKTFAMLSLFAANAGRVLSKQELMDAVWPNVYVGDDSLFQCIKEIRTALGDERRQIVKLVSGRGYLFDAEVVSCAPAAIEPPGALTPDAGAAAGTAGAAPRRFSRRTAVFAAAGVGVIAALAMFTIRSMPDFIAGGARPTVAVMSITAADSDTAVAAMAANVTTRLSDGLAKIENIRVEVPQTGERVARARQADYVVNGELRKAERSWEVRARMTRTATGEVVWTEPVSVAIDEPELEIQQSRVAAAVGHPLARRISAMLNTAAQYDASSAGLPPGSTKVVIEQATASIVQTSRERFETAQTMLEKALAADANNVDLAVALAGLQMRGVQMVWYSPAEKATAESNARATLERALRSRPGSIPVLEAYCRFLNAINEFVESLVACARVLNFDPWNGVGLYNIGLGQMQLGRFDDALTSFKQADRFDTPQVSRWTWRLGIGLMYVLMKRGEEALPWLQSSIAITPASGRSYMVLAAAYQQMGRPAEAKAAMVKALALRPDSNLENVKLPRKNASAAFLAASERIGQEFVESGLPER
jgi:DNA-binding winged helix-turn-helix (wHTH) protein/tetratricopeptide (TPR) repeat protein